jgi:hypothetical protein
MLTSLVLPSNFNGSTRTSYLPDLRNFQILDNKQKTVYLCEIGISCQDLLFESIVPHDECAFVVTSVLPETVHTVLPEADDDLNEDTEEAEIDSAAATKKSLIDATNFLVRELDCAVGLFMTAPARARTLVKNSCIVLLSDGIWRPAKLWESNENGWGMQILDGGGYIHEFLDAANYGETTTTETTNQNGSRWMLAEKKK